MSIPLTFQLLEYVKNLGRWSRHISFRLLYQYVIVDRWALIWRPLAPPAEIKQDYVSHSPRQVSNCGR